jgi:hypothetical protein
MHAALAGHLRASSQAPPAVTTGTKINRAGALTRRFLASKALGRSSKPTTPTDRTLYLAIMSATPDDPQP